MSILFCGDIMPGGLLSGKKDNIVDKNIISILNSVDLRIGTLECALGNEANYDINKVKDRGNVIYAKENDILRLKQLRIDIVSLANNHFFDLGINGAIRTIELLKENNIEYIGAGVNIKEARKPVVRTIKNKKVAFLAFCDTEYNNVYYCTYATDKKPGVNPMTKKNVEESIRNCKKMYDYVIVLPHWGKEHTFYPNVEIIKWGKFMVNVGADAVLGSHPHRVQPIIKYKNAIIAFSMGNFLFPERLIAPPKVTYYPTEYLDLNKLPITDGYPIVDQVTLKTLPYLARIGMIIECTITDANIELVHTYTTYLNHENKVELLKNNETINIQNKLVKIKKIIELNIYREYIFCKSILKKIANKLKTVIL